ncbi:hypothetical protein PROFUN_11087 [Planoprotostelium fungivorum]|uniref:Choline transporter-like protein n=1 Tax=Planoprotostelium fungivorum TaxID=1890364 RepID=A0A2P6NAK4_9EUKA|nr:hypothetical protein PROFUN_11087 [Planoprotostelium fungivorum]
MLPSSNRIAIPVCLWTADPYDQTQRKLGDRLPLRSQHIQPDMEYFSRNLSILSIPAAWVLCIIPHIYSVGLLGKYYTNVLPRSSFAKDNNKDKGPPPHIRDRAFKAESASQNGFEGLPLFIAAIVLGNLARFDSFYLNSFGGLYLLLRVLYVFFYITTTNEKLSYARSLVWMVQSFSCLSNHVTYFSSLLTPLSEGHESEGHRMSGQQHQGESMFSGYNPEADEMDHNVHRLSNPASPPQPAVPSYFSSFDFFDNEPTSPTVNQAYVHPNTYSPPTYSPPTTLRVNHDPMPDAPIVPLDVSPPSGRPSMSSSTFFRDIDTRTVGLRDKWFFFLFLLTLIGVALVFVISALRLKVSDYSFFLAMFEAEVPALMEFFGISSLAGVVFTFAFIQAIRFVPVISICLSIAISGIFYIMYGVYIGIRISFKSGVSDIVWGVIILSLLLLLSSRIKMTGTLIKQVIPFVYPRCKTAMITAHLISYSVFLFLILWFLSLQILAWTVLQSVEVFYVGTLFLDAAFIWVLSACVSTVHTTVATGIASWYFPSTAPPATLHHIIKSNLSCVGSICFSSAARIILSPIVLLCMTSKAYNAFGYLTCGACFWLLKYNKYAFPKTFHRAAADTQDLLQQRGMVDIVNQYVLGSSVFFSSIFGGIITAIMAFIWLYHSSENVTFILVFINSAATIGFGFCYCNLAVVDAACSSIFVFFSMEPENMRQLNPALYEYLAAMAHGGRGLEENREEVVHGKEMY